MSASAGCERGWTVARPTASTSSGGRLAASPARASSSSQAIERLVARRQSVAAQAGGGGIPVSADGRRAARRRGGDRQGLNGGASGREARRKALIVLTDVLFVERDWGTAAATPIIAATPAELRLSFAWPLERERRWRHAVSSSARAARPRSLALSVVGPSRERSRHAHTPARALPSWFPSRGVRRLADGGRAQCLRSKDEGVTLLRGQGLTRSSARRRRQRLRAAQGRRPRRPGTTRDLEPRPRPLVASPPRPGPPVSRTRPGGLIGLRRDRPLRRRPRRFLRGVSPVSRSGARFEMPSPTRPADPAPKHIVERRGQSTAPKPSWRRGSRAGADGGDSPPRRVCRSTLSSKRAAGSRFSLDEPRCCPTAPRSPGVVPTPSSRPELGRARARADRALPRRRR